ncbi:NACHT domain-containing protein [Streptomyces avermitilis]|uniref:NACHT domain-containing protein n=1 Tax=Streptomyces avermitilis TaxID=33903 RepID=UPI00339F26D4
MTASGERSIAAQSVNIAVTGDNNHIVAGYSPKIDATATDLAGAVLAMETQQVSKLLGARGKRIDLVYQYVPEPANTAAGAEAQGRLTDILGYYRNLCPHRLVITGAPGAGKTVLALQLMLDNLDTRDTRRVPVRFSLTGWDTVLPLEDWLAQQISVRFGIAARHAKALVGQRRVLPVLDGLDEMDAPDTHVENRRAARALDHLDIYQDTEGSAPVILTCRTDQYKELAASEVRMRDAARVEIRPLRHEQIIEYLTDRIASPTRWRPVLKAVADRDRVLTKALNSPWRLNLVTTVYERNRVVSESHHLADPAELLTFASAADIRDHLLSHYVSATLGRHPDGDRYSPPQTHQWLAEIATGLAVAESAGSGGTDIALHELWPLAGVHRVRLVDGLLTSLLCLAALASVYGMLSLFPRPGVVAPPVELFWLPTLWRAGKASVPAPRTLQLHRRRFRMQRRQLRRVVVIGLLGGLLAGLLGAVAISYAFACPWAIAGSYGLAGGLVVGCALGLASALTAPMADAAPTKSYVQPTDPRQLVRDDLVTGLMVAVSFGAAVGLGLGPALGLAVACTFGLAVGLMFGLYWWGGAGRRYLVALCCLRGRMPWKLGAFLHWAAEVELLRISGAGYQFRHRELQDWLVSHPYPQEPQQAPAGAAAQSR